MNTSQAATSFHVYCMIKSQAAKTFCSGLFFLFVLLYSIIDLYCALHSLNRAYMGAPHRLLLLLLSLKLSRKYVKMHATKSPINTKSSFHK